MCSHYLFFLVVSKIKHKFYRMKMFGFMILINNKLRQSLTNFFLDVLALFCYKLDIKLRTFLLFGYRKVIEFEKYNEYVFD